jgi:hypothetical protein
MTWKLVCELTLDLKVWNSSGFTTKNSSRKIKVIQKSPKSWYRLPEKIIFPQKTQRLVLLLLEYLVVEISLKLRFPTQ